MAETTTKNMLKLQQVKQNVLHFTRRNITRRPEFRRLLTSNYSTGRLAFGEKNVYGFSYFWVTIDLDGADVNLDLRLRKPLPFADHSQSIIYSSHTVEHLNQESLDHFLKETYRLLKAGGYIRLETPDAKKALESYRTHGAPFLDYFKHANAEMAHQRGYPSEYGEAHIALLGVLSCYIEEGAHIPVLATKTQVDQKLATLAIDEFCDWAVSLQTPAQQQTGGHVNPTYFEKLKGRMEAVGFKNIRCCQNRQTYIPDLDITNIERTDRAFYSFYIEAEK